MGLSQNEMIAGLSQADIIKSLSEAVSWLEKEIGWGATSQEWRHLTGRIGELYVAMLTRGVFAPQNNQPGYDVVSAEEENISVKTITTSNHVNLNGNTINAVDRVIIVQISHSEDRGLEINIIYDQQIDKFKEQAKFIEEKNIYQLGQSIFCPQKPQEKLGSSPPEIFVKFKNYEISQMKNGRIEVLEGDNHIIPAKPVLREIAREVNVSYLNGSGNPKNTQQLGADIIRVLKP